MVRKGILAPKDASFKGDLNAHINFDPLYAIQELDATVADGHTQLNCGTLCLTMLGSAVPLIDWLEEKREGRREKGGNVA